LVWNGSTLTIRIDEITAPLPSRLAGVVKLHANTVNDVTWNLDDAGLHRWRPIAPHATVEVELTHPRLHFSGPGYLDYNAGDTPLSDAFARWSWSRAVLPSHRTAVLYDTQSRAASSKALFLRFDSAGGVTELDPPPRVVLPPTTWRIARATRAEEGDARVLKTLENTPFYARSILANRLLGEQSTAVHESLSLDRFDTRWVQTMLPFRMPRTLR